MMRGVRVKQIVQFGVVTVYVLLNLFSPLLFRFLIDNVVDGQRITDAAWLWFADRLGGVECIRENLWIGTIVLVTMNLVLGYVIFIRGKWNAEISETVARSIRNDLYRHLQLLPYSFHVKAKTGDLIQRCTSDVDTIRRFLAGQLSEMVYSVLTAGIAIVILYSMNPKLALIGCAILPLIVAVAFIFFRRMQRSFTQSDEAEGVLSATIQENLTGMRVVKAFQRERYEIDRMDAHNRKFRDLTFDVIHHLAMYWGISDFICLTQILITIVFGIIEARNGNLSTGAFFVFVSYEGMILWPMRNLGRILSDMGKMTVSIRRILTILETPAEDVESGKTPDLNGDIVFDHVSFQYDDGITPVLEDISFTVKKGQTVAIMGPTGSGKSSLVHLLTRLYDPTSGTITINGTNIIEISKQWLRRRVGIVLQEPFLFSRSILDNIKMANPKAEMDTIYRAARIASVHEVIEEFDRGYDTLVGEKGVTLSGGQKQRIAIARTIVNDAPILIFDDSLSAVDTETDAAIRHGLDSLQNGMTTFIITQRVSSAQHADCIIVLEDKHISQIGTHEELMRQDGLYRRIYTIQTANKAGDEYESDGI